MFLPVCAHRWWDSYCPWWQQSYAGQPHSNTNAQHVKSQLDQKKTWRRGFANGTKRAPSCFTVPLRIISYWSNGTFFKKLLFRHFEFVKDLSWVRLVENRMILLNTTRFRNRYCETAFSSPTWWKAPCWISPPSLPPVGELAWTALWRSRQQRDLRQDDYRHGFECHQHTTAVPFSAWWCLSWWSWILMT